MSASDLHSTVNRRPDGGNDVKSGSLVDKSFISPLIEGSLVCPPQRAHHRLCSLSVQYNLKVRVNWSGKTYNEHNLEVYTTSSVDNYCNIQIVRKGALLLE